VFTARYALSPYIKQMYICSESSRSTLGHTHPTIIWVPVVIFLGVKRPKREADHSPHNNNGHYSPPPIPPYAFMTSTKATFTFTFSWRTECLLWGHAHRTWSCYGRCTTLSSSNVEVRMCGIVPPRVAMSTRITSTVCSVMIKMSARHS
jgi:hypothetical protein